MVRTNKIKKGTTNKVKKVTIPMKSNFLCSGFRLFILFSALMLKKLFHLFFDELRANEEYLIISPTK